MLFIRSLKRSPTSDVARVVIMQFQHDVPVEAGSAYWKSRLLNNTTACTVNFGYRTLMRLFMDRFFY